MSALLRLARQILSVVFLLAAAPPARADYIDHFATRADVGLYKVPSQGTTRVLVIPVIVDDQPFSAGSEAAFRAELDDFFAVDDRSVFDGGFRFTAYWEQASLGRFRPEAVVADPVRFSTCPPLGAHADCRIPRGAGFAEGDIAGAAATLQSSLRFVDEIFRCALEGPGGDRRCTGGGGVDLAAFDQSGVAGVADGFVDGVLIVSNAAFPGIALPVKDLSQQPLLALLGALPSFTYGEHTIPSVGIAGFARAPARETFVAVHEFGHLLGFCDLYNEAGTTTDLPWSVMGGWYSSTPASLLDPFSRVAIGWGNVIDVGGPGTFRLPNATRSGVVLKVGRGNEFFLVEHRARSDGAIDGDLEVGSGVFIERVRLNKRPSSTPGSYLQTLQACVNCEAFDSLLMVEEADGAYDLQFRRARDDAADLFQAGQGMAPSSDIRPRSTSNPVFSTNLLSGAPTGLTITVDDSDDDGATITVGAPARADACGDLDALCLQDCVVDEDGHGRCGAFEVFPTPTPTDDDDDLRLAGGCACPGAQGAGLLPVLFLVRRRRRR